MGSLRELLRLQRAGLVARRRTPRGPTQIGSDGPSLTAIPAGLLDTIQAGTMRGRYRGRAMLKNPFDLALYSMLLDRVRPRTIIEIGTNDGGSALWFADRCPDARVISIDLVVPDGLSHPGVTFLQGDAEDLVAVLDDETMAHIDRPLLVVEDSSHHSETVRAVLRFFDRWMHEGEYLVVEDGILTALGWAEPYGGGPLPAIAEFLDACAGRFVVDREYCDFFGHNVTWNVDGYLRRTSVT